MLDGPELAGGRVKGGRLQVPVAEDQISGRASSRFRNGLFGAGPAIRLDVDDLAEVIGRVLRLVAQVEPVAQGHEEIAVAVEDEARAPMVAAGMGRLLAEDDLNGVRAPVPFWLRRPARHAGAGPALAAILREAQIDEAVLREIRIERHIEKPALPAGRDARDALERLGERTVGIGDAQAAGPFRDQHAAVRQEGEAPGILEIAGDRLDDHFHLVGAKTLRVLGQGGGERAKGQGAGQGKANSDIVLSVVPMPES